MPNELLLDPAERLLHSVVELGGWSPSELILDQGVVAISAVYTFGCVQLVRTIEFDIRDFFHDVDEAVDRH